MANPPDERAMKRQARAAHHQARLDEIKAEREARRSAARARREARGTESQAERRERIASLDTKRADLVEQGRELRAPAEARKLARSFNAKFGGHKIRGGTYHYPGGSAPVAGASAVFESGADKRRMTATRVVTGGVVFGPAGAVVGGLLKKNKSKCYVTVTLATGDVVIVEAPAKGEAEARRFAAKVNAAGARLADGAG